MKTTTINEGSVTSTQVPALTASESDPVAMRWMVGAPPPADKLIRFADNSFLRFPQSRWSFSNMRQFLPTRVVRRGSAPAVPFPRAERDDIDRVTFTPIGAGESMTWLESLDANYVDGIVVLHRGTIVYERYRGVLAPERQHIAFSVTKSFVATLAAVLVVEGVLDDGKTVAAYIPELASTGIGDATIRQLLDMTTGLDYTEDYNDPRASVRALSNAGSFRARPRDYQGPESHFEYFKTLTKEKPHGEAFSYKTVNTDVLGLLVRRVSGEPLSDLLSDRIFSKLAPEHDAFFTVDSTGAEFAGGGLNLTLRDLLRFGEMIRRDGTVNGQPVVPLAVVDDIRRGGDRTLFAGAAYSMLPGWSYRTMWWVSHNDHGAFTARGVHGQALYIDPAAEMVIARFGSHPFAGNVNFDPTSLPAYHAVATHLMA